MDSGNPIDSGTPDAGGNLDSGNPADSGTNDAGVAFAPCAAADYVTTPTTITFPGLSLSYSPQCLTIPANSMVTFSGPFLNHPLKPSTRGTQPSPIMLTNNGTTATFNFPVPGYYPYYCGFHGADDGVGNSGMAGVIQVQ